MRIVYLVFVTAVALFALLLAAVSALRAQGDQPAMVGIPEYCVTLSGSPENTVLENHSGRVVIGYDMKLADDAGQGMILSAQIMAISVLPAGIPHGGTIYVPGNVPVGFQRPGRAVASSG